MIKRILILIVFLASCTVSKKQEAALNEKIQEQPPADSSEKVLDRAAMTFFNIEGLTVDQKTKLTDVYYRVYDESMKIRSELGKSQSLLFETVAKPNYKPSELNFLKRKITKLERERLKIMFNALDEVRAIVGYDMEAKRIYRHFNSDEIIDRYIR